MAFITLKNGESLTKDTGRLRIEYLLKDIHAIVALSKEITCIPLQFPNGSLPPFLMLQRGIKVETGVEKHKI